MTFNKDCRYLDLTRMESNRSEKGVIGGGVESNQRNMHPCMSEDNELDWIYECPEDCPHFKRA